MGIKQIKKQKPSTTNQVDVPTGRLPEHVDAFLKGKIGYDELEAYKAKRKKKKLRKIKKKNAN